MRAPVLWVDVTTTWGHPYRRLSGIARTELEVGLGLARDDSPGALPVRFVRRDWRTGSLRGVALADLEHRFRTLIDEASVVSSATVDPSSPSGVRRQIARLVQRPRLGALVRAVVRVAGDLRRLARSFVSLGLAVVRLPRTGGIEAQACVSDEWERGDVFLHLGLWGDATVVEQIARLAAQHEVVLVQNIYDLIPVVRPQFALDEPERDRARFRSLVASADIMLYAADNTLHDARELAAAEGFEMPVTRKVPIASAVVSLAPIRPPLAPDVHDFVLCVGTIEIRKNHQLLLDVWESFVADPPDVGVPTLVVAGSLGWSNAETLSRLRRTPGFADRVVLLESPSDAELSWLYRHCAFTVYPSFYEGWGLPITESLDAGKVCLASNTSSMPEASEGLGELLDPKDWRAWRRSIVALFVDEPRRRAMEQRIALEHHRVTQVDVVRAIREVIVEARSMAAQRPTT